MGRRKKARKPPPKRKALQALDGVFNCPFCNHEKSCDVKMNRDRNTGYISCRVCLEDFQTTINYLSEPIDVYGDWIDACESANNWEREGIGCLAIVELVTLWNLRDSRAYCANNCGTQDVPLYSMRFRLNCLHWFRLNSFKYNIVFLFSSAAECVVIQ